MKSIENVKEELRNYQSIKSRKFYSLSIFCFTPKNSFFLLPLKKKEALKESDPLADFIGAVECGSLAQNINSELYETDN